MILAERIGGEGFWRWMRAWLVGLLLAGLAASGALAQPAVQMLPTKGIVFPDYYPASNGVRRIKTLVTSSSAQMQSQGVFLLQNASITNYTVAGQPSWTAFAPVALLNLGTGEVSGPTNVVMRTADQRFFLRGVGFLFQRTNMMLTLSNDVFTWIDRNSLTNLPTRKP
jgi:hypothetical protein